MNIKEAFEVWWKSIYGESMQFRDWQSCDNLHDSKHNMEKAWQVAADYARQENTNNNSEIINRLNQENKNLREALEKLSLYVSYNGDTWVRETAREALKELGEE